jgi:cytochrome d ubiquinol oxidase subunit I
MSLTGFVLFYTVLAVIDVFLLKKYVKLGPGTDSSSSDVAADAVGSAVPVGLRH